MYLCTASFYVWKQPLWGIVGYRGSDWLESLILVEILLAGVSIQVPTRSSAAWPPNGSLAVDRLHRPGPKASKLPTYTNQLE